MNSTPVSNSPGTLVPSEATVPVPSFSISENSFKRPIEIDESPSSAPSKKKRSGSTSRDKNEDKPMPDEFECFFLGRTQGLRPLYVDPSRLAKLNGWSPSHCQIVYRTYGDEIHGRPRSSGRSVGVYSAYETYCVIHDRRCPHVSVRGLVHVYEAPIDPVGNRGVSVVVQQPGGQPVSATEEGLKAPVLIDLAQEEGSTPPPLRRLVAVKPLPPVTAKVSPTSTVVGANERSAALLTASREQTRSRTPPPAAIVDQGYLSAPSSPGYSPSS